MNFTMGGDSRAVWISAVYQAYDKAILAGASSEDVLQNIARVMCGKDMCVGDDDGCGARRESAKQLVISVLLARECGSDPILEVLDQRF